MSHEDVNIILSHCDGAETAAEVVQVLLDRGVITNTTLRDLRVVYQYTRRVSKVRPEAAVYDIAESEGISPRTVYRARKKYNRET